MIAKDIEQRGQVVVRLVAVTMDGPPNFALRKFTFNVTENNDVSKTLGECVRICKNPETWLEFFLLA